MNKPVCLIVGAGAGIGGHVAKRFAREGYHACLARRRDRAGLDRLVAEIEADGGSASGHMLNVVEEGSIEQLVTHIEAEIGPISVAVYNLGAQIGDRGLSSTTLKAFEMGWRMATFGLFRLAGIAQQIYYRYHHKQTDNPAFKNFWIVVHALHWRCLQLMRKAV